MENQAKEFDIGRSQSIVNRRSAVIEPRRDIRKFINPEKLRDGAQCIAVIVLQIVGAEKQELVAREQPKGVVDLVKI
jgi:hypothetical protein